MDNCEKCNGDLLGFLFEEPWFVMEGGHPGDSGPGGNTPQDPEAWGTQECPHCGHKFEVHG